MWLIAKRRTTAFKSSVINCKMFSSPLHRKLWRCGAYVAGVGCATKSWLLTTSDLRCRQTSRKTDVNRYFRLSLTRLRPEFFFFFFWHADKWHGCRERNKFCWFAVYCVSQLGSCSCILDGMWRSRWSLEGGVDVERKRSNWVKTHSNLIKGVSGQELVPPSATTIFFLTSVDVAISSASLTQLPQQFLLKSQWIKC